MNIPISSIISRIISPAVAEATVEIIYSSHPRWPLTPLSKTIMPQSNERLHPDSKSISKPLHIAVLDSSFNPPTLAHLALAQSDNPLTNSSTQSLDRDESGPFDARLLLLSVRNADKALKPGDATFVQRVEMMIQLAHEMEDQDRVNIQSDGTSNVAVGVINEPTFVGKSTKLLSFLKQRVGSFPSDTTMEQDGMPPFRLSFMMGYDTLIRFFNPKFYESEETMRRSLSQFFSSTEEGSNITWSRRGTLATEPIASKEEEEAFLERDEVKQYVEGGKIRLIGIGERESKLSSTDVRAGVKQIGQDHINTLGWETMCPGRIVGYIKEHGLYAA